MTNKNLQNIIEQINNLSKSDLVSLNNIYCQENNCESEIFSNDEDFFNTFFEGRPNEAVRAAHFGNYDYAADWVKFNGYGNLDAIIVMTTNDLCESVETIAEYALENQKEFDYILTFDFDEESESAESCAA